MMGDERTILLGMNQPVEEAEPLDCRIPGSAGRNLQQMIQAARPEITEERYLAGYDRRNVLSGTGWSLSAARERFLEIGEQLAGRRVVVLGREVSIVLRLGTLEPLVEYQTDQGPLALWYVPHPSGRNRWYNSWENRSAVGRLLSGLYIGPLP